MPNLAERNLGGPEEKPPEKFLKFLFLKTLQIHQILKTSSYLMRAHTLIFSSLHNYWGRGVAPPLLSPDYGIALVDLK